MHVLLDRSFLHSLIFPGCVTGLFFCWFFFFFLSSSLKVAEPKRCRTIKVEDGDTNEEPSARSFELSPSPTNSDISISRWALDKGDVLLSIQLVTPLKHPDKYLAPLMYQVWIFILSFVYDWMWSITDNVWESVKYIGPVEKETFKLDLNLKM